MNPPAIVERPPEPVASAEPITYYGLPVIKQPVWIWTVPVYFFVGGVAGSAMVLGAVAQSADRRTDEFAQLCHWTGAIGGAISSVLLITDLGRPSRFLNMLRVLRPSSPMSLD
jgi:formate-dependent nitrite reductase membrane component NrfD